MNPLLLLTLSMAAAAHAPLVPGPCPSAVVSAGSPVPLLPAMAVCPAPPSPPSNVTLVNGAQVVQ